MSTLWIVTAEVNAYEQEGEYFVCGYDHKPTFQELKEDLKMDDVTTGRLTRGGGRKDSEFLWFNLRERKQGEGRFMAENRCFLG